MKNKLIFCSVLLGLSACQTATMREPREGYWAQRPVLSNEIGLANLWQVSDDLYRSEQPNSENLNQLIQKLNVRTMLNLRTIHQDNDIASKQNIQLIHLPMIAGEISQNELVQAIQLIQKSPKPVLLHCRHGSDRTGAVVAAYRIAVQNWTPEKAADELASGGYGYHDAFYPNIKNLILNINPTQFKQQVFSAVQ